MLKPGNVNKKLSKYSGRLVTFIPNHVRDQSRGMQNGGLI
jgi:hypothetical protein